MTSGDLIALSATVERWLTPAAAAGLVVLAANALLGARARQDDASRLDGPPPAPRTEYLALAGILAVATLVRVVGWDGTATPPFWFSEAPTLHVGRMLEQHTAWSTIVRQLGATQAWAAHDSAILLPVLIALQSRLGARFGLPTLAGAAFGIPAVALAWALGRRVRSPAFGLLFAAFVAVSPMQIMWSRLGSHYSGAVAHVLLAMLVGWIAAERRSVLLAIVTGILAWASVYHYYAARVAIPLALAALIGGAPRGTSLGRRLGLVLACVVAFGAIAYAVGRGNVVPGLWPTYTGYVGNKGERNLVEFVTRNAASIGIESRSTLERYFFTRRTGWGSSATRPGMQDGGLTLLPTAFLGVLGLLAVCRRVRTQWLWLALGIAGFALSAMSVMTSRRAIVFDLAWCAFAAHGVLALVDGLGRSWSRRVRIAVASVIVASIGLWGTAAVFALSAALPEKSGQHIPFAEAGFGDGITCTRCLEAGREWRREIADGAFVVLFDNDAERENRTSPGGLMTYGKIAALGARAPRRFVEGYSLMGNFDLEPPTPGRMFDSYATTFAGDLAHRVEHTRATYIVWHFERPTLWERRLAERLVRAGGTLEVFPTPLGPDGGIRVVTPWHRRAEALAVIQDLAVGFDPREDSRCVTLSSRPVTRTIDPVFLVTAAADAGAAEPPQWLVASWHEAAFRAARIEMPATAVGGAVARSADGHVVVELLGTNGVQRTVELPSGRAGEVLPGVAIHYGLDCAARIGGAWWTVEPFTGRVASTDPAAAAIPPGGWMGIARGPRGEVVLAGAEQQILVFDPATQREVVRFDARVPPTVRETTDECTPIAAGSTWIATVNLRTGVASFYDYAGGSLGTRRVDRMGTSELLLTTIGGAGRYLAVAAGGLVRTFEVVVDPSCAAAR
ncbi:MAG TPA: hypothetical protein VMS22_04825 [Candidatus Eisenbacteria bacterium]|nr:hypothetical protein [Candidatus Eisenbacteria bacterium]